jgi:Cytochrome c554 and c-prime
MNARWKIGVAALVALIGWGLVSALTETPPAREPSPIKTAAPFGYAGTGSCSGRGCHGGTDPDQIGELHRNEYTFCLANDKHSVAYSILFGDRATRIARNLAPGNPDGQTILAHEDERCLACHTVPRLAAKDVPPAAKSMRTAGVGCEACHGPAAGPDGKKPWLAAHTVSAKWDLSRKLNDHDRQVREQVYDFTDLADTRVRVGTCVGCHVGSPPDSKRGIPVRDCNHDIMAAGHPRLNFEMVSFEASMPPHWAVEKRVATFEPVRLWAVGRVMAARAALELLRYRAEQAERAGPTTARWPEFAEYRCFACHADFNPNWRDRHYPPSRIPGSLPYDPWYHAYLPELAQVFPVSGIDKDQLNAKYNQLEVLMSRPYPDPVQVRALADALVGSRSGSTSPFDRWLERLMDPNRPIDDSNAISIRTAILRDVQELPRTWEEATQLALALGLFQRNDRKVYIDNKKVNPRAKKDAKVAALDNLFQALAFPPGYESPAGIKGRFSSREDARKAFETLLKGVGGK